MDYSHIEARVNDMVKRDGHLTLVLGQLISNTYRDRLAEEINDLLQEKGHVTIVGLTQTHDLPADFIREVCIFITLVQLKLRRGGIPMAVALSQFKRYIHSR